MPRRVAELWGAWSIGALSAVALAYWWQRRLDRTADG